ncbi:DUF5819 family protein [Streptomyces sp. NPDC059582]|uniref:DUF5819 family protein n=1 Tax=Streptomyces sp. NPDC059582 TaxID=3346875 RepID=UPI003679E303
MDAYGGTDAAGGGGNAPAGPGTPPAQEAGVATQGADEARAAGTGPEPETSTEPVGPDVSGDSDMSGEKDASDGRGEPDAPDTSSGQGGVTSEPRTGVAALSPRYQIGAALALAVVAVAVCVHIGMVFLHVAPSNTITKKHGKAIEEWIYPEFEQNWKLFAPNPLQQNVAVQVRAEIETSDGGIRTTGWYDLSAEDGRAIDGNLLPSHVDQNELRRSWDFFAATHGADNRPVGMRGALSETYLRHIVVRRLAEDGAAGAGDDLERVQVRSSTTNVSPPEWSGEQISLKPVYRVLPWWTVPAAEAEGAAK